jgi:hypothetical protein
MAVVVDVDCRGLMGVDCNCIGDMSGLCGVFVTVYMSGLCGVLIVEDMSGLCGVLIVGSSS